MRQTEHRFATLLYLELQQQRLIMTNQYQYGNNVQNSPVRTSPEERPLLLGILRRSIADARTKMAGSHPRLPKGDFRLAKLT